MTSHIFFKNNLEYRSTIFKESKRQLHAEIREIKLVRLAFQGSQIQIKLLVKDATRTHSAVAL